jgi:hypothetical protein
MTGPKPPPADLPDFLDELADEQELDRLSKLSPEELRDEMKKEGLDPERGRAAVRRGLEAAGADTTAPAVPPANVVSLAAARERRRLPVARIALAAAAAVVVTVGIAKREALEAWLAPSPTAPQMPPVPPTHAPTPPEKAAQLRAEAYVNIAKGYYGDAEDQLDEAKTLDPDGDKAPQVSEARGQILASKPPPPGYAKPPVGPGERPLPGRPPK